MEDTVGTYARPEALPVSASGSFEDPQQQQIPRGGSGGSGGAGMGRGEDIPPNGSYEAPPSPLPSPMPQMASISADSSDEFGLREIFANAESRSRSQDEAEKVDGKNSDAKMDLSQNTEGAKAKLETTRRSAHQLAGQPREAASKSEPNMADGIMAKPEHVDSFTTAVAAADKQQEVSRKEQLKNGRKLETPSPKPSNSGLDTTPSIPVSSPRAKLASKSESATPVKSSKASTPSGKGSGKGAGSGSKPPSGSKAKAPPQSPPPLPIEAQLAGHRRMACKARSVPEGHTPQTAYLTVAPMTPHGTVLACSHPLCSSSGKRFRFCVVCDIPVAKRNFLRRHSHGLINGGATCAAGLAPGLAAGLKPPISGAVVAPGSEGTSPASTPQYDTPTSPGGASSGGDVRSDEEAGQEGAGNKHRRGGSRTQKSVPPSGVLASPGHAGMLDRNERPVDPNSPMSTGSVRPRTASDGSNRTAHGSPGKRPREGGSPPRRGLVGTVVNGAPPAQAGAQPPDPGIATGSTPQLARPLPYRPPPIQHCVSWPMVASGAAGHHSAHGAPPVPTSPMAPGPVMYMGGPQWAPSTPGGTPYATTAPHYASWTAGSPHQQQQAVLSPAVRAPPPSATSAISPRQQQQQQQQPPTHSGAPEIPHASALGSAASTTKKATVTPRVSPRYLRGPAMSFDAAIDRDRKVLPSSHHRYSSDGDHRVDNNVDNRRTLSPGLLPELGRGKDGQRRRDRALSEKGGESTLHGSSSNEDMIPHRNYDRPSSWTMGRTTVGRIEFRRRSSPPRRPDASIWRGRMKSDSALPAAHAVDEQHDRSPHGHPSPHSRTRQASDPLPHVPSVRPFGANEDDFEPPTPEVSVMRLSRKERMWLNLLRRRPFDEETDALKSWMDEVMNISDPRSDGDDDDGVRGTMGVTPPPRQLSEVVRHARVMPPPPSRKLGDDLEREKRSAAEGSSNDGRQMEPPTARQTTTRLTRPSSQSPRMKGKEIPAAGTRGDKNATNQAGKAVASRSSPREDLKVVVTPPEQDAITERMTEGLAGFFGCGTMLNADDTVGSLVPCAPCAPCANTGAVDDTVVRRGGTSRDLTRPLPVSQRQQSKGSVASSVSMGNSSAAAFFENTAIMDIDRSTDPLFERMPRGGSVSSASVSEIGENDLDDTDRRVVFENGVDGRIGGMDVHMQKASPSIGTSAAGVMDMEAQWRGGEGIARG